MTKAELEAEVARLEAELASGGAPAAGSQVQGFGRIMLASRGGGAVHVRTAGIDLVEISTAGEVRLVMGSGREVEVLDTSDEVLSRIVAAELSLTVLGETIETDDDDEDD